MITSTRQYKITRTRATEVRNTLAELRRAPVGDMLQPEMRGLQLAALRGTSTTSKLSWRSTYGVRTELI